MAGQFIIFAICMCGCALSTFHLGRRAGVESTVQYLISKGVIELDYEDE